MSRRRAAPLALVALLLSTAHGAAVPIAVAAPAEITGAFIDGWPGSARPYVPLSRLGADSMAPHPSNFHQVYIESVESPWMSFDFLSGDTSALEVGSYSTTTGAVAQIQPLDCSAQQVVTFDILEIERDAGGLVTRFAADFAAACPNWQPPLPDPAWGSIRYRSTIGFHAFGITPVRVFPWQPDVALPDQPVGSSGSSQAFVVTNTGSMPLAVGASDPASDDLDLGAGTCDGGDLDPGSTCSIAVTFSPSAPGGQDLPLTLLTPDLPRPARPLVIHGLGTTETSVTLTVDPMFHEEGASFQGYTSYDIDLQPPGAIGSVEIESTCTVYGQTAGSGIWRSTPPGPCQAWATFTGNTGSGYLDSTSDAVAFDQPVRTTVWGQPIAGDWVTGNVVTVHVAAEAGNGPAPSDGTLSLIDVATDDVLASVAVTDTTRSMDVDVVTWTAGMRELRATYDSPTVVGSTALVRFMVEADESAPTLTIHPDDFTGYVSDPAIRLVLEPYDMSNEIVQMRISNDGVTWFEAPYAHEVDWSITDPTYGGTAGDGERTIHAMVRDTVGLWSDVATWPITLDRGQPTGSMAIEGGDPYATSATVVIDIAGTDAWSPLASLQLSNDGTTWTTLPYSTAPSWTLGSAPSGLASLASGAASRTVYARWKDAAGNWSPTVVDSIQLDAAAPTATVPRRGFAARTPLAGGAILTRIPWSGSDVGSGIARYELHQQTNGGAWTTVSTTLTSPSVTRGLATEKTYRFRVRAVDKAGNLGAWVYGDTFRVSRFSETNTRITYNGTWAVSKATVFWGGQAKASSRAGSRATMTFTGRSAAWVSSMGPTRGKADVYVNGSRVATVDLYSPTSKHQQVVWVGSWTTAASRTVSIRVLGTSGRPRVDIDALVTAN